MNNEEKILSLLETMNDHMESMDKRLGHLEGEVSDLKTGQAKYEARFDGLEVRFDGLEARFDGLETRFDGLETRFDSFEAKVDVIQREQSEMKGTLNAVFEQTQTLTEFKTEMEMQDFSGMRKVIQQIVYDVAILKSKVEKYSNAM